jgi:hypothetical protein
MDRNNVVEWGMNILYSHNDGTVRLRVMGQKIAKIISVIMVAPLVSVLVLSWMWLDNPSFFGRNLNWYFISLGLLTLVPISAYLLKYVIPSIRMQGRDGERKLAFIMAVAGYIAGVLVCQIFHGPHVVYILFVTYFISGFTLLLLNRFARIKASGHACGLAGPITFLICLLGGASWITVLLIPLVFWARVKMERHKINELIIGSLTGIFPAILIFFFFI